MTLAPRVRALIVATLLSWTATTAGAITLPTDFVSESVAPGSTFDTPTGIAFLPGGRLLVAEKRGRVWAVKNGLVHPTPLWSRENEVLNNNDRGLLDIAVDPNYAVNHYLYFLYTVDPDSNGTDDNDDAFGRLTRYTVSASDSNVVDYSTRTVLMGVNWTAGPPSGSVTHTIACLRWGSDGSLLVSVGDGAQFTNTDQGGQDPGLFGPGKTDSYQDIGAFRSQSLSSLAGKVLRLDPATGHGYPSNPYWDGNATSIRSRVWSYGLRNPFRFCVRPGTGLPDPASGNPGTLYVGDVGWVTWEEINVAKPGGRNFGWPCFEGFGSVSQYQSASPAHNGCGSIGTADNPTGVTSPIVSYNHNDSTLSTPPGLLRGNAIAGSVFYTGARYPAQYLNKMFFADYPAGWIRVLTTNANDQLVQVSGFALDAKGPVDLVTDPASGDLYYVSIYTGEVRHIRYTGVVPNHPPTAVAAGSPTSGAPPLTVNFSSAGTNDIDGDPLDYAWLFGDGTGSTQPNPQHVYTSSGTYDAILTVDDGNGGIGRDTVRVIVVGAGSFPTTGILDTFDRPDGPIGGLWVDEVGSLAISGNALAQPSGSASTVWSGATFGPSQEVYVTFDALDATAFEHDLMLKVQGTSWSSGHIEVHYDPRIGQLSLNTYAPGPGWAQWGAPVNVTYQAGDQFGARADSSGTVQIFRNGVAVGTWSVVGWPFANAGGRLGMTLTGAVASRLDDFGGGTTNPSGINTPPVATLLAPADGAFYAAGDSVLLHGTASDAQDPPAAIQLRWDAILHHNNHTHPGVTLLGDSVKFVAQNHDDGTGVWYEIDLTAIDTQGARDTVKHFIYPEIDLTPSGLATVPHTPGTTASAQYQFRICNFGRMPAPISHWQLTADGATLAQGDTLVPALDSVTVTRLLPPTLAAGVHLLRVRVDTLGTVYETNETNDAQVRSITVVTGPGPDEWPPLFTSGPTVQPAGVQAWVEWANGESTTGTVRYGTTPSLTDSVTASPDTAHTVLLPGLTMGVKYYVRVTARDSLGNAAIAALDSFTTQTGPLGVGDNPSALALSPAWPNPTRGRVDMALDLPAEARVAFSVHDLAGRTIWSEPARLYGAGRWRLGWSGRTDTGGTARTGVYLARVTVNAQTLTRRLVLIR